MICQILRGKGRILGIVSKRKRRTWLRYNLLESNSWRLCHIRISCMWLRSSVIVEWLLRHRRERRSRRLWWGWACSSWIWIKDFSDGFGRLLEDRSRLDDFSLRNSSPFYRPTRRAFGSWKYTDCNEITRSRPFLQGWAHIGRISNNLFISQTFNYLSASFDDVLKWLMLWCVENSLSSILSTWSVNFNFKAENDRNASSKKSNVRIQYLSHFKALWCCEFVKRTVVLKSSMFVPSYR